MIEVRIETCVKSGVLDPEAQMMLKVAKNRLGHSSLKKGYVGRVIVLEYDQSELTDEFKKEVESLCSSFLVNAHTETYRVEYRFLS